jgi:hypothetical protein
VVQIEQGAEMPKAQILLTDEIPAPPALVRLGIDTLPVTIGARNERLEVDVKMVTDMVPICTVRECRLFDTGHFVWHSRQFAETTAMPKKVWARVSLY